MGSRFESGLDNFSAALSSCIVDHVLTTEHRAVIVGTDKIYRIDRRGYDTSLDTQDLVSDLQCSRDIASSRFSES